MSTLLTYAIGFVSALFLWAAKELFVPDLLDWRRQSREARRTEQAELRAIEREDAPVRQRIAAALRTECKALRRVFIRGQFSLDEWQVWHNELKELVESDAGARALGDKYLAFVEAIKYDQLSINIQTDREAEWSPPEQTDKSRLARYKISMHDAYLDQNVATVLQRFAPLLEWLGLCQEASTFENAAAQQLEVAKYILSQPPG